MAKQNNPQIVARKETVMTIADIRGDIVIEVGQREYTVRLSDGSLVHRAINQHIQTVDGASWSPPTQLANPPIYVGICQQCREGVSVFTRDRSHGICLMARSRVCTVCGTLCCPTHRKIGRDQRWRCLRHHRTHRLKTLIRPLFSERVDEP